MQWEDDGTKIRCLADKNWLVFSSLGKDLDKEADQGGRSTHITVKWTLYDLVKYISSISPIIFNKFLFDKLNFTHHCHLPLSSELREWPSCVKWFGKTFFLWKGRVKVRDDWDVFQIVVASVVRREQDLLQVPHDWLH